jgi:hypothetical protein
MLEESDYVHVCAALNFHDVTQTGDSLELKDLCTLLSIKYGKELTLKNGCAFISCIFNLLYASLSSSLVIIAPKIPLTYNLEFLAACP